jgi:hypothetical protein
MAKEYKRIGGRGARRRQFFTKNTLWLGADHLLQVEHTGYTEEYKRFYFRDIQSIIVQKDNRFLIWSLVLGGLLATCIALIIWIDDQIGKIVFGWVAAPLFLALVINLIKGPSCYTRIKTAVQEEEVPAFRRVRKTQKALARVRELISAAQGTMSGDEIRARLSNSQTSEATSSIGATPASAASPLVVSPGFAPPPSPTAPPSAR